MFFILVMLVPSLVSKAASAPSKLLAKGGEAWAAGRSRLKKGGKAAAGVLGAAAAKKPDGRQPRSSQVELLQGDSAAATAGAPAPLQMNNASAAPGSAPADAAAYPEACAAELSAPQRSAASVKADLAPAASAASSLSAEELEVVLSDDEARHANTPLYLLWAVACYAIAVVLLAIGTESFVHNSVSALATVRRARGAQGFVCGASELISVRPRWQLGASGGWSAARGPGEQAQVGGSVYDRPALLPVPPLPWRAGCDWAERARRGRQVAHHRQPHLGRCAADT